jgi:hypothetical protein
VECAVVYECGCVNGSQLCLLSNNSPFTNTALAAVFIFASTITAIHLIYYRHTAFVRAANTNVLCSLACIIPMLIMCAYAMIPRASCDWMWYCGGGWLFGTMLLTLCHTLVLIRSVQLARPKWCVDMARTLCTRSSYTQGCCRPHEHTVACAALPVASDMSDDRVHTTPVSAAYRYLHSYGRVQSARNPKSSKHISQQYRHVHTCAACPTVDGSLNSKYATKKYVYE